MTAYIGVARTGMAAIASTPAKKIDDGYIVGRSGKGSRELEAEGDQHHRLICLYEGESEHSLRGDGGY